MKGIFKMRNLSLAILLSAVSQMTYTAGPVWCSNCSTRVDQQIQILKEVETAANTAKQLKNEIEEYKEMLKQGKTLPSSMFDRLNDDLARLKSLYSHSKALAGNVAGFDEKFRNKHGDYNKYLHRGSNQHDNHQRWADEGLDAMRTGMKIGGENLNQIAQEDATLEKLVKRSQDAEGRMQAIQAGNEISAQLVQQLQKLRQLLNAQIQAQSAFSAQQIERQAREDAAFEKFMTVRIKHHPSKGF